MGTEYTAAAEWAEREMTLPRDSATAVRGDQAAAYGRSVLARTTGDQPIIDRLVAEAGQDRRDDPELESEAYAEWAVRNARQVWSDLD